MSTTAEYISLIGRICFMAMFLYSAQGHLLKSASRVEYARNMKMPLPAIAGWPAGLILAGGGLSIGIGIWPDLGALLLAAFIAPAGFYFHRFWRVQDQERRAADTMSFWRNITLMGACLALFVFFATVGHSMDTILTGPIVDLR